MSEPTEDEPNVNLAPPALRPKAGSPWGDDALQRQGIASELNALVGDLAHGENSATIALDGSYGTGKTFVLERWVQAMQDQGRVAVYYNAWENDCDDDPLVSLIEALASDDKTEWGRRSKVVLNKVLDGILRKFTGVDALSLRRALDDRAVDLLDAAAVRRAGRQKLKELLAKLVEETREKEEFGVVVVIDELDRCKPTFAIELLERVKHVLNVPGLVFVFGVNMITLRETVKAVYGDIDAHQYLLRMLNATLHMPPSVVLQGRGGKDQGDYIKYLVNRHGLRAFCERHSLLASQLSRAERLLSLVIAGAGTTPREMERIVWLLSKVASSSLQHQSAYSMLPLVLIPLAVARVKAPDAYYEAVSRSDRAPAVIDCFFDLIPDHHRDDAERIELDTLEMTMYRVCHEHPSVDYISGPPAYVSLWQYAQEEHSSPLDHRHLSRRLANIDKERARALLERAPLEEGRPLDSGFAVRPNLTFATLQSLTSRFDTVWPRTSTS